MLWREVATQVNKSTDAVLVAKFSPIPGCFFELESEGGNVVTSVGGGGDAGSLGVDGGRVEEQRWVSHV